MLPDSAGAAKIQTAVPNFRNCVNTQAQGGEQEPMWGGELPQTQPRPPRVYQSQTMENPQRSALETVHFVKPRKHIVTQAKNKRGKKTEAQSDDSE